MSVKPELLAPAGNWDALVAAVQNGADAVYLGGKLFNARQSAANFDDKELVKAVEYAHIRGVKVYITVNTLIADQELEDALRFLFFLRNAGADAVIIQDLGLARAARIFLPELSLHASTQMTVHNRPALEALRKAGFKRFILAREISLENIKMLKKQTRAEVEVFVHGALCICYSGQCLFSSMIGGRSGNRGRCAQPCRLKYELTDCRGRSLVDPKETGEYILSTRDLNMSSHLPDLINAGIDAFKIEGRMKRPEYVAVVTHIYRKLIDRALALGPDGYYIEPEEAKELAQIFNRGFTIGYFYGRQGRKMMSCKRPNNRGVFLGRVYRYDRSSGFLLVTLEDKLYLGDCLEIWISKGGRVCFEVKEIILNGQKVNSAQPGQIVKLSFRGKVRPGDRIFKTHDEELIRRYRNTFTSPKEKRKMPVSFFIQAKMGKPLLITVKDEKGNTGIASTKSSGQPAQKQPLTCDFLYRQINRLGNTPFSIGNFECDIQGNVIVPVGEINEARRKALSSLEAARLNTAWKRITVKTKENCFKEVLSKKNKICRGHVPLLSVAVNDLSSLQAAVQAGANLIYFGGEFFRTKPPVSTSDLFRGVEYCHKKGVKFILASPRIISDSELSTYYELIKTASGWPADGVLAGNLGLVEKIKEAKLPFYADFALNIFNAKTCEYLKEKGAVQVVLSPELTLEQVSQIASLTGIGLEVFVHGEIELMVSEYCVLEGLIDSFSLKEKCSMPCQGKRYYLKDRSGILFPVEVDQSCRMHVFNSKELCLLKNLGAIIETGVNALRIDIRRHGPDYVYNTVRAYRQALDQKKFTELAGLSPSKITTGHFFRGVE